MKSRFIEIFARHRVAANLLMIIMIISGFWAVTHMNTQFLPNFDLNYITVTINWPGANAKDVERSVTIPTEEALRSVDNLKRMSSKSILGASIITMEFNAGTNMTEASNRVQQEINIISNLPKNSDPPIIKRLIPYESVAHLLITGGNNLAELRQLSYRFERQLLDRGIAKINIVGLPKKEVMIEIPTLKLAELNMSLAEIAKRINQQSTNLPAGTIGKFEVGKELHSAGQARRLSEFARLPIVTNANGHMIRLGDIAKISERPRNSQVHVSYFGKPAVEMTLQRIRDSSALESARILQKWLAQTRHNLPAEIIIKPYYQSWKLIKERINLMLKNALFGLVLILFLLFLFLNIRIASWVAIGIPASFLAALALLYLFGGTINMVSLFAMIMTLGIIVDDSIVVGEEVLARMQAGKDSFIAIKSGVQTMFTPIMASSLTTIVTFSPLMLVGGIIGQTLFEIPLFVICIIIASLVECFLILPGHIYHSSKTSNYKPPIMQPYFNHFRDTYFRPMLWACLKNRWATICVAISLLIVTAGLLFGNHIKFNFFPSPEGTRIFADAQFIAGTPPSKVKQFLGTLEKSLAATNQELKAKNKNKNIVITNTSFQNRSSVSSKSLVNNGEQYASINVELTSPDSRKISNQAFIKAWRKNIKLPAGIENFTITQPRNGPPGRDIDIELSGNTLTQLKAAATKLKKNLTAIPGVDNVTDDLPFGKEHLIFRLTAQGHALGLTTTALGQQLRAAFQGAVAQVFYEPQDEVKVRVVLPPEERHHIGTLTRLPIITPKSKTVPLSSVASLENQRGFDELRHQNGKLSVRITADVDDKVNNSNTILELLKTSIIPKIQRQHHFKINFSGRAEEQAETFHDMLIGLFLALILVYLVLAWVFSSYGWPLVVMVAIPLGLVGAIWGHVLLHLPLTLLSLFGFFGLAGIVVNDSIILLMRYKKLRSESTSFKKAIVEATCQRLRAVILTSMTTIAGLLPLLFETSLQAQFLIPMAVSITFGLMTTTILILVLIPCLLYVYEERVSNRQLAAASSE